MFGHRCPRPSERLVTVSSGVHHACTAFAPAAPSRHGGPGIHPRLCLRPGDRVSSPRARAAAAEGAAAGARDDAKAARSRRRARTHRQALTGAWVATELALALVARRAGASVADDRYDSIIRQAIDEASGRYPVPLALVKGVIRQESAFRPGAVSKAGARGLMQVMPATAVRVGVHPENLFDPAQNIRAGVRLLSILLEHYRGDIIASLVAYNARPRRLFAPVPRNGETPEYVWKVLAYYEWYSRQARTGPGGQGQDGRGRVLTAFTGRP
jgi:soluble lytic murein transglycosylase-like protein